MSLKKTTDEFCLETTSHKRQHLVDVFRQAYSPTSTSHKSCIKRLLHPGTDTPVIVAHFISTIKAFRMLDPPGVLLDKVARPIQKYLKSSRCIAR
jgi:hypothetical protein